MRRAVRACICQCLVAQTLAHGCSVQHMQVLSSAWLRRHFHMAAGSVRHVHVSASAWLRRCLRVAAEGLHTATLPLN